MMDAAKPGQMAESLEITDDMADMLYARHVEVESFANLTEQRGTPIPALFNQFYKFIQNPSTVSVETFKRMIDTDDTVGSGVDFLTTCLAARLGAYQHKSPEITKWVNNALEQIEGGFFNLIKELLSATWAGFAVQEKVWKNSDDGFIIQKTIPLPPSTVLFETERTGELTFDGIMQYQRNYNPMLLAQGAGFFGGAVGSGVGDNTWRPDAFAKFGDLPFPMRTANSFNYLSIRIPRMKCIHYAFDAQGKLGNPYGRSLLRRAYKFYVMKDEFLKMLAIALDRKGTPLTVVYADQNTTLLDGNNGQLVGNQKGQPKGVRADVAAQKAFEKIHNDSVIVLPGKKDQIFGIDVIQHNASSDVFIAAIDLCNKSILRALLVPSLIFGNGDGTGSYSLGQEHAKTFDKILDGMNAGLKQVLLHQVIKELIAYNFPREMWEKDGVGDFARRELTQDERSKEAEVFEKGINAGIIDNNDINDLNKMRDTLGFEPRDTIIPPKVNPMMGMMGMDEGNGPNPPNDTTDPTEE